MARASRSILPAKKVALLHVAQRDLKLSEEDYRSILERIAGVQSARNLDELGFERVIKHLSMLGFRSTWNKRTFGNRPGMASPSQVELIRKLWREYRGTDDEADRALNTWLERFHHVTALRFISSEAAAKVIPGLKRMAGRKGATL